MNILSLQLRRRELIFRDLFFQHNVSISNNSRVRKKEKSFSISKLRNLISHMYIGQYPKQFVRQQEDDVHIADYHSAMF